MKSSSSLLKASLAFILPNTKAGKRIGPHDRDIISVLVGSLLGDSHAERLMNGGVKFRFRQTIAHKDYIFWLYNFFNSRGYCTNNLPVLFTARPQANMAINCMKHIVLIRIALQAYCGYINYFILTVREKSCLQI
jgi:hypothetical protein